LIDPFAQDLLLGPHLSHKLIQAIGQPKQAIAVLRAAAYNALLNLLDEVGNAALHVEQSEAELSLRARRIARTVRAELCDGGKPLLKFVVEAGLGLPSLQIEKAEDQRACQAEQRRGECRSHATQRCFKARLQFLKDLRGLFAFGIQRLNGLAYGTCC